LVHGHGLNFLTSKFHILARAGEDMELAGSPASQFVVPAYLSNSSQAAFFGSIGKGRFKYQSAGLGGVVRTAGLSERLEVAFKLAGRALACHWRPRLSGTVKVRTTIGGW
jgi:hypothetical protein